MGGITRLTHQNKIWRTNYMNKEEIRNEWKQYMVDDNKDYSLPEFVEKFSEAVGFLKEKGIRIKKELLESKDFENEYRLTDDEKLYYTKRFMNSGYRENDAKTIVKVMDTIYHMLDISKEEAEKFTEYAADNHMTLTDALSKKYGISLEDTIEYTNIILESYLEYGAKKTIQYGKEVIDILSEAFPEE